MIEEGVVLLVPPSGAVWEFLQVNSPDWHRLRPYQHIPIPQLAYGLRCLSLNLIPRSAMVVHGVDADSALGGPETLALADRRVYDIVEPPERRHCALTGVFRNGPLLDTLDGNRAEPFGIIWEAAHKLWLNEGQLPL